MSKITLNAEAAAALAAVTTKSELCGPDGRSLGVFIPPGFDDDDDNVTLEELKAADEAGGEYTMEDVFKLLEKDK
jgi:rRNA maturation protein Nop10